MTARIIRPGETDYQAIAEQCAKDGAPTYTFWNEVFYLKVRDTDPDDDTKDIVYFIEQLKTDPAEVDRPATANGKGKLWLKHYGPQEVTGDTLP